MWKERGGASWLMNIHNPYDRVTKPYTVQEMALWTNGSPAAADDDSFCYLNLSRNSCSILPEEAAKRDAIATVRLVVSCLSLVGSLSIIVSVIATRQICSPKVHPIFVLSVADCLLAILWVLGALLWLTNIPHRAWCFLPSVMTVTLECVSVNLTLVYALFAYSNIKQKDVTGILANMESSLRGKWRICRTAITYILAWSIPAILVLTTFGLDATINNIVKNANNCSCWCLPYYGNVLPFAFKYDRPTAVYIHHMRKLVASYGAILGTNYLVVFVLLVVIYWKTLRYIRTMKKAHAGIRTSYSQYGAVETLITKGQSRAKKRVVWFLTVFIITGFSNVVLSYTFAVYEGIELDRGVSVTQHKEDHLTIVPMTMYMVQSLTVPMQGFLNAIVYGWTREDFLHIVVPQSTSNRDLSSSAVDPEVEFTGSVSVEQNQPSGLQQKTGRSNGGLSVQSGRKGNKGFRRSL